MMNLSPATLCRLSPKAKIALRHLRSEGNISHAEAALVYKLPKVAKQIWELRTAGIRIFTDLRQDATGVRYARYNLPD